jgi:hypothetical protein
LAKGALPITSKSSLYCYLFEANIFAAFYLNRFLSHIRGDRASVSFSFPQKHLFIKYPNLLNLRLRTYLLLLLEILCLCIFSYGGNLFQLYSLIIFVTSVTHCSKTSSNGSSASNNNSQRSSHILSLQSMRKKVLIISWVIALKNEELPH